MEKDIAFSEYGYSPILLRSLSSLSWISPRLIISILLLAVSFGFYQTSSQPRQADIPFIGLELGSLAKRKKKYVSDANALLSQGYTRFKNGIFQITTTEGTRIVAGQRFYEDLINAKDDELSFTQSIMDLFATHYTGVLISDEMKELAIIRGLTPDVARLIPKMEEEIDYILDKEIGPCEDWTSIHMCQALQNTVTSIIARLFVGYDLCRNPEWLTISVEYWMDAFTSAKTIKWFPVLLRPLAARLMPQPARMRATRAAAQRLVQPIIRKRVEAAKDPNWEKPDDLMQWIIDRLGDKAGTEEELHHHAHVQLALAMGAIHSTVFSLLHEMFDLTAYEEIRQPLRDEFSQALAESDGVLTKGVVNKLHMLDSFLKESQRFNPPGLTNGRRKTVKDFHLSDGTLLPKGSNIEMAANSVNRDPAIHENPDQYDAFRFYKLRQALNQEEGAKYQYVASNRNSLNWGIGRHACPGRFFAADETKIIISKILQRYDLKLIDGETKRYANTTFETMVVPDMEKHVLFKKRATAGA